MSVEKPGRAIYLIKERSKLVRAPRKDKKHEISQRLTHRAFPREEQKRQYEGGDQQRRHALDTTMIIQERPPHRPHQRPRKESVKD